MKPTLLLAMISIGLLTGCGGKNSKDASPHLKKLLGKECIVQFDRQTLGAARDLPVPPATGSINGAETCVTGTLKKYDSEWIVLENKKTHFYIPTGKILLIQQNR